MKHAGPSRTKQRKPLIGIAPCYFPRENTMWHAVKEAYSQAVWDAHGVPVVLTYPNSTGHVDEIINSVDGVLMIGGPDLPVHYYGGNPYDMKGEDPMHSNRVAFDRDIFDACKKHRRPLLGICAGLQHINIIHGGALYEDIASQLAGRVNHGDYKTNITSHLIEVRQNSVLFDVLKQENAMVNSTHHQGIRELGDQLRPTAWSSDGLIEAIEPTNSEASFIAVQWHPELMRNDAYQRRLFAWLIEQGGLD